MEEIIGERISGLKQGNVELHALMLTNDGFEDVSKLMIEDFRREMNYSLLQLNDE